MFGSYAAFKLFEEYDHVFIDRLFDEKAKINEHLEEKENEDENKSEVEKSVPKNQKEFLYKLRKEKCVYHNLWDILENVYGETKDDYTEEEIEEIKNRQEKRYQKQKEKYEESLKNAKPAPTSINDDTERGNDVEILAEDELDTSIEEDFGVREDMLNFDTEFIPEDKILWEQFNS